MAQTCTITSLASGMALTVAETGMLTVTPATGDVNQQFLITYGEAGAMRIATAFGASLFAGGAGKFFKTPLFGLFKDQDYLYTYFSRCSKYVCRYDRCR